VRTASGSYSVHTQRVKGPYGLLRLTGGEVERVPTVRLGVERGGAVTSRGRGEAMQSRTRGNVDVADRGRRRDEELQRAASLVAAGSPSPPLLLLRSLPFLRFSSPLGGGGWEGEKFHKLGFSWRPRLALYAVRLGWRARGGPGRRGAAWMERARRGRRGAPPGGPRWGLACKQKGDRAARFAAGVVV